MVHRPMNGSPPIKKLTEKLNSAIEMITDTQS